MNTVTVMYFISEPESKSSRVFIFQQLLFVIRAADESPFASIVSSVPVSESY
jgi:hypothetical protein